MQDICQSAVKELELEKKLNQVIGEWKHRVFTLETFKGRGELLLNVDSTTKITSQLEDSLMMLATLSGSRYDDSRPRSIGAISSRTLRGPRKWRDSKGRTARLKGPRGWGSWDGMFSSPPGRGSEKRCSKLPQWGPGRIPDDLAI